MLSVGYMKICSIYASCEWWFRHLLNVKIYMQRLLLCLIRYVFEFNNIYYIHVVLRKEYARNKSVRGKIHIFCSTSNYTHCYISTLGCWLWWLLCSFYSVGFLFLCCMFWRLSSSSSLVRRTYLCASMYFMENVTARHWYTWWRQISWKVK